MVKRGFMLCLIEFDVLLCYVCLAVCIGSLVMCCFSHVMAKDEAYAFCQVCSILIASYIAITEVVNHLGDASDVETYARCAATHGLGNRIGQVVLQAWRDENIGSAVEFGHHLFADRAKPEGFNAVGQGYLLRVFAHDDELQVVSLKLLEGFDEEGDALALVGYLLTAEEEQSLVFGKSKGLAGLQHVDGMEEGSGNTIVDVLNAFFWQCLSCLFGNPVATTNKDGVPALVHRTLARIYIIR